MITYNEGDYNLPTIKELNEEFNGLETKHKYYVYGLLQTDNPPVFLERNAEDEGAVIVDRKIKQMGEFLFKNGVKMEADYTDKRRIQIGLRKDLRENTKYAAALIRTIVAFFEGAVILKPSFKLPEVRLSRDRHSGGSLSVSFENGRGW